MNALREGHTAPTSIVTGNPDGCRVATSSFDTTIRVFDARSGECLAILTGHTREVSALAWAADGRIVSGSRDGTVRVWDASSGRARVFRPHDPEGVVDA